MKGKVAFAVATFTLVNGKARKDSPSLDLCPEHVRVLQRRFRPVGTKGPLPGSHRLPPEGREARTPITKEERQRIVLAAIKKGCDTGPKITEATGIGKTTMMLATQELRKQKLITTPGWSKGRRYLVKGKEAGA